ncbi:transmembrane protein 94 [Aplysia californica]|uniref:Transmembrane protein 94 n=1 Tax=Aplysia californica TaxID=6500 RepID=A0ABM1W2K0_APLCA|nr:transmembrane protein 94 [Aplysia californica]
MESSKEQAENRQGLGSEEAVVSLCEEIETLVASHEQHLAKTRWRRFLAQVTHTSSYYTVVSYLCVVVVAVTLLIAASMEDSERFSSGSKGWLITEALVLLASVVFNTLLIALRVKRQTAKHIDTKRRVIDKMQQSIRSEVWSAASSHPDLHTPLSPCISLQWCVRSGTMLNLPQAVLVSGDLIVLRPGHAAPGLCDSLDGNTSLQSGEIFMPHHTCVPGEGPQPRIPLSAKKFILKETPIVKNLRLMLQEPVLKPASFLENERYNVCNVWLERRVLPITLILFLVMNVLRHLYIDPEGGHWSEIIIILQVHGILPVIPVLLPFLWTAVNTFGQAHILSSFDIFRTLVDVTESTESLGSCSNISVEDAQISITWRETMHSFWSMFCGTKPFSCPDFDMLHALGSVTALCCVDKKGILSWPNPSAEKVIFFSSAPKRAPPDDDEDEDKTAKEDKKIRKRKKTKSQSDHDPSSNIEVLDLTHETAKDAFGVNFDDPRWKDHLNALKPMGLDILLNTCNGHTSEWYSQFTDHVSCAARENKDTVAVVNRRCLFMLSREIGFTEEAVSVFTHEATLGMYRQVPLEEAEREKQNRARSFIQHKIPMPNQVSVVARDKLTGICQLLTQGTGDLVLDCCTDAWTGSDLQLLSEMDRKRVLDFYHRNSMIAYCTAFAYKPLPKSIDDWSSEVYTELVESPSATKVAHGEDVGVFLEHDEKELPRRQRSHSVDSLLELSPSSSLEEFAVGRILQSHQSFIGMVSLQYQAKQDFVQMIDKLESACIRFVHFSKENEVRSRVFAEKMGIEAGWNCHVSLMPSESVASANSSCRNLSSLGHPVHTSASGTSCGDGPPPEGGAAVGSVGSPQSLARVKDSLGMSSPHAMPRTHSAPSFMNVDEVQVKFAKETLPITIDGDHSTEEDSILLTDIGLSQQPSCSEVDSETAALLNQSPNNNPNLPGPKTGADGLKDRCPDASKTAAAVDHDGHDEDDAAAEKRCLLRRARDSEVYFNEDEDDCDDDDEDEEEDLDVQSDSRYTSSYVTENTEDSLTGALDNRNLSAEVNVLSGSLHWRAEFEGEAHLPRGIENIRPHLKNVDNVPLLVNLFTDCTPEATCEMVRIMQEYGEVVLAVGSSLNMLNTAVFMQADCSMAIEPLYPQLCAQRPALCLQWNDEEPTPTQLASCLLSLPCSLAYQRNDNIKLVQLIMESRHYIFAMRNCFYLMLCCLLAVVLSQLVCCVLLLPPVMAAQHVMWLVMVVVPAISLSLMGNPNEARTMSMATHKNTAHVNRQMIIEFFVQFCTRFLPSIVVAVVCFAVILHSFCVGTTPARCSLYDVGREVNGTKVASAWTDKFQGGLVLAQNIFHLYFVIFLVAISMSLVHWQDHLWQRCPLRNFVWSFTAGTLLILQFVFSVVDSFARRQWFGSSMDLSDVHPVVWVLGCVWPLVTISLNEVAKRREIKLAVRRQRRARLDFDTKLGMNSPF